MGKIGNAMLMIFLLQKALITDPPELTNLDGVCMPLIHKLEIR